MLISCINITLRIAHSKFVSELYQSLVILDTSFFTYTWIYSFFYAIFSFRLLQNIEQSSLCYIVGPHWPSILKYSSIYVSIPDSQSIPTPTCPPWQSHVPSLSVWVCFYLANKFICIISFRFHIWMMSYDIYLSLSGLLHLFT